MVWSIQVCINTVPRRKGISNDLKEVTVATHQCGQGYKAISKQYRVHHGTVRNKKAFMKAAHCLRSESPSKFTLVSDHI